MQIRFFPLKITFFYCDHFLRTFSIFCDILMSQDKKLTLFLHNIHILCKKGVEVMSAALCSPLPLEFTSSDWRHIYMYFTTISFTLTKGVLLSCLSFSFSPFFGVKSAVLHISRRWHFHVLSGLSWYKNVMLDSLFGGSVINEAR